MRVKIPRKHSSQSLQRVAQFILEEQSFVPQTIHSRGVEARRRPQICLIKIFLCCEWRDKRLNLNCMISIISILVRLWERYLSEGFRDAYARNWVIGVLHVG